MLSVAFSFNWRVFLVQWLNKREIGQFSVILLLEWNCIIIWFSLPLHLINRGTMMNVANIIKLMNEKVLSKSNRQSTNVNEQEEIMATRLVDLLQELSLSGDYDIETEEALEMSDDESHYEDIPYSVHKPVSNIDCGSFTLEYMKKVVDYARSRIVFTTIQHAFPRVKDRKQLQRFREYADRNVLEARQTNAGGSSYSLRVSCSSAQSSLKVLTRSRRTIIHRDAFLNYSCGEPLNTKVDNKKTESLLIAQRGENLSDSIRARSNMAIIFILNVYNTRLGLILSTEVFFEE